MVIDAGGHRDHDSIWVSAIISTSENLIDLQICCQNKGKLQIQIKLSLHKT